MSKFLGFLISALLLVPAAVSAQSLDEPGIFGSKYAEPGVAESFVVGGNWLPYPEYSDREGWNALLGDRTEDLIREGERFLDYNWQTVPATAYLAYERTGDRTAMESVNGANGRALLALILAELAEGQGRFIDQIANGVWLNCQRFSWVLAAHQPRQRSRRSLPDDRDHLIDLGSGGTGAVMSYAYRFFHEQFDELDPSISLAVKAAVKKQILDPFLDETNYKANWWLGLDAVDKVPFLNNWTPWCNANSMICFLLMEDDQERLDRAVSMSVRSVDLFMKSIRPDGGCDEGTSYWDHAAGKLYDWMQIMYDASGGRFDCFDSEQVRRMGEYISRSYVGDGYVVNFADASARDGSHSILIWNYGHAVGSREMTDYALFRLADHRRGGFRYPSIPVGDIYRALEAARFYPQIRAQVDSLNIAAKDLPLNEMLVGLRNEVPAGTWYDRTEVCYIRNSSNWFLAAKGGFNNESHNHNDAGSCILYIRNIPVLADAGVGTYTKQTFSRGRYDIWTMQSDWHNLPLINGVSQPFGDSYRAEDVTCSLGDGTFSADISKAYSSDASCRKWVRSYALSLSGTPSLTITDSFVLYERRRADVEHFLVWGEVILPGETYGDSTVPAGELLIVCPGGLTVKMTYPKRLTPSVDVKELDDPRLSNVWGPSLRRISLTSSEKAPAKGSYEIRLTVL